MESFLDAGVGTYLLALFGFLVFTRFVFDVVRIARLGLRLGWLSAASGVVFGWTSV